MQRVKPLPHRDAFLRFCNRADPDQAALVRAAWSGSTLLAIEIWLERILHWWTWQVISLFYVQTWTLIYIISNWWSQLPRFAELIEKIDRKANISTDIPSSSLSLVWILKCTFSSVYITLYSSQTPSFAIEIDRGFFLPLSFFLRRWFFSSNACLTHYKKNIVS